MKTLLGLLATTLCLHAQIVVLDIPVVQFPLRVDLVTSNTVEYGYGSFTYYPQAITNGPDITPQNGSLSVKLVLDGNLLTEQADADYPEYPLLRLKEGLPDSFSFVVQDFRDGQSLYIGDQLTWLDCMQGYRVQGSLQPPGVPEPAWSGLFVGLLLLLFTGKRVLGQ